MLRDGEYAAWFRTSRGEGTGILRLANGRISGGDCMFDYSGSYQVDDDRFTATLMTRRHAAGPTTVFGVDEVELKVTGKVHGITAWCSGTTEQAPGVIFEATLFLGQDQPPQSDRKCVALNFDASKLPKGSDSRYLARNPLVRGLTSN